MENSRNPKCVIGIMKLLDNNQHEHNKTKINWYSLILFRNKKIAETNITYICVSPPALPNVRKGKNIIAAKKVNIILLGYIFFFL